MRSVVCAVLAIAAFSGFGAPAAQAAPRDEIVISGSVVVPRGQTAKTVVVIDGPVSIAGHVTGDVVTIHGVVTISGTVDGTVTTITKRARLLPGAHVGGDVQYGDQKPVIAPGALVGGDVKHKRWSNLETGLGWAIRLLFWLAVTISTLVLGLALLAFAPRAADAAWVVAQERTWRAVAWAAGLFFGLPILAIVLMITVFGLPLGLGLLLALFPLAALGYVTSGWVVGRVIGGAAREWSRVRTFLAGWVVLRLVALVPVLGGLAWVLASAFGLGVLLLAAWYASKPGRLSPAPAPPAPTGA